MNKEIAKQLEYESFGEVVVLSQARYFKGILCSCWCECGTFFKVDREKLETKQVIHCGNELFHGKKQTVLKKKARKVYVNKKLESRYNLLKHNNKSRKVEISLSLQEYCILAQTSSCHYCDAFIDWMGRSSAYFLDRKDNDIGYTFDNCVVCCTRCNMSKGNRFTYEEWCSIGKTIQEWNNKDIKNQ